MRVSLFRRLKKSLTLSLKKRNPEGRKTKKGMFARRSRRGERRLGSAGQQQSQYPNHLIMEFWNHSTYIHWLMVLVCCIVTKKSTF